MKVLVFVESDEGSIKKSSLEAVSYAAEITKDTVAIVFGVLDLIEFNKIGAAGAVPAPIRGGPPEAHGAQTAGRAQARARGSQSRGRVGCRGGGGRR